MAASKIWSVQSGGGSGPTGAFRASKTLYTGTFGTNVGISAVTATKSTPVYSIGELVKVGWLVPINVYTKASVSSIKTTATRVYCSAGKAEDFIAACRKDEANTGASALTLNSRPIVSASRPRKQSFS